MNTFNDFARNWQLELQYRHFFKKCRCNFQIESDYEKSVSFEDIQGQSLWGQSDDGGFSPTTDCHRWWVFSNDRLSSMMGFHQRQIVVDDGFSPTTDCRRWWVFTNDRLSSMMGFPQPIWTFGLLDLLLIVVNLTCVDITKNIRTLKINGIRIR